MWHHLFLAWKTWANSIHSPLWNPYGAAITASVFALVITYMLISVIQRE